MTKSCKIKYFCLKKAGDTIKSIQTRYFYTYLQTNVESCFRFCNLEQCCSQLFFTNEKGRCVVAGSYCFTCKSSILQNQLNKYCDDCCSVKASFDEQLLL